MAVAMVSQLTAQMTLSDLAMSFWAVDSSRALFFVSEHGQL